MEATVGTALGTLRLVPTPGRKGTRWLARPDPRLAALFTGAVAAVVDRIESGLGPQVVANRVHRCDPAGPHLELEPFSRARCRFAAEARHLAAGAGALLGMDVRDCYPSIQPVAVAQALGRLGCSRQETRAIERVLARFSALGVEGLPVGPDPSAVLANAVLAPADEALRRAGVPHLRWVDDFWIFLPTSAMGRRAADRLVTALAGMGLEPAPEKTRLLEGAAVLEDCAGRPGVSGLGPRYHRRSDAYPVPGLGRPYPVTSTHGRVDLGGRPPRRARGLQ